MKNDSAARSSDGLIPFFCGELALAPYRAALSFMSMAHQSAETMFQVNRMLFDAYRDIVRGQQDAFGKATAGALGRLSRDGATPAEAAGFMSQSWADIYRSAVDGAAGFEKAMSDAQEKCFAELWMRPKPGNETAGNQAEKKAA